MFLRADPLLVSTNERSRPKRVWPSAGHSSRLL